MSDNIDYSSDFMVSQTVRSIENFFADSNDLDLIKNIALLLWLVGGLFAMEYTYIFSLVIAVSVIIINSLLSLNPESEFDYDIHGATFGALVIGGISHWRYSRGIFIGKQSVTIFDITIPIVKISQAVLVGLVLIWFATRYIDELSSSETDEFELPFLVLRGVLRGVLLVAFFYSVFESTPIPENWQIPWLFSIFLIEPVIYGISKFFDRTLSYRELTFGQAKLPIVAIRSSMISNFILLFFIMVFNGVSGEEWEFLRVLYLFLTIIVTYYSIKQMRNVRNNPLGSNPIGNFLKNTPNSLETLDLKHQEGFVIEEPMNLEMSKDIGITLNKGSILVPLEEQGKKQSALIIGEGTSKVRENENVVVEDFSGVSSTLISKSEIQTKTKSLVRKSISDIDLKKLNLPEYEQLELLVHSLGNRLVGWMEVTANKLASIDLSGSSIKVEGDRTRINLPGIKIYESNNLTNVRIANLINVNDSEKATTVQMGNFLRVIDIPNLSYVSLPFLTVLDIENEGSVVNLFGMKIEDGISYSRIAEFKKFMLEQVKQTEYSIEAQLGRSLASSKTSGFFSLGYNNEFKPLLANNRRKIGTHKALKESETSSSNMYLSPEDVNDEIHGYIETSKNISEQHIDDTQQLDNGKTSKSDKETSGHTEFKNIVDAEIVKEDEEDENPSNTEN